MGLNFDKSMGGEKEEAELKTLKMPLQLRVFYRICNHHLQKTLISVIKLCSQMLKTSLIFHTYMCLFYT